MNIIKAISRFSLILIVHFVSINVQGQNSTVESAMEEDLYKLVNQKYGIDQTLVNGKIFENIYLHDQGHPYFSEDVYQSGYLLIHDQKFDKLMLKYNIFDQSIVVFHNDQIHSQLFFIPPFEFISEFSIGSHRFKKYSFPEKEDRFYEQIYLGQIECLCFWNKNRDKSEHNKTFMAYKFYDPQKQYFLVMGDKTYPLKNKKALIKLFADSKKDITQFMKRRKIKLHKSSGQQIAELIAFCEEVSKSQTNTTFDN